jgi:hypothetical protein
MPTFAAVGISKVCLCSHSAIISTVRLKQLEKLIKFDVGEFNEKLSNRFSFQFDVTL